MDAMNYSQKARKKTAEQKRREKKHSMALAITSFPFIAIPNGKDTKVLDE